MRPALLAGVLLLAAGLRFAALDFGGRGVEARPDEGGVPLTLMAMERGTFLPPSVLYGGGYFEPLFLFTRAWGAVAWDGGMPGRVAADDREALRWAARLWSACLAFATVGIVYAVGRRVHGLAVAMLAAALVSVSPLAVREAHFAKADTAAAFAAALVMAACILPNPASRWRSTWIGAALAAALSTKLLLSVVPGAVFTLAWADGTPARRVDWRSLGWAALVCVLGVLVLNRVLLGDPVVATAVAWQLVGALSDASWLPGGDHAPSPFVYHTTVSLRWGCGFAVTALALPAAAFGLRHGGGLRVVALLVVGHAVAVLASPMVLARFFLPAVPGLAILVAALVVAAIERVIARPPLRRIAFALVALLLVLEPMRASIRLVRLLGRTDTRTLAGAWIDAHLPADTRLVSWGAPVGAADFGRPPSHGRWIAARVPPALWPAKGITAVVWHHYPLPYSSEPLPHGAAGLRRLATFDPFTPGMRSRPVVEPLDAFYLPLGRLDTVKRPGPYIEILALEPGPGA